LALFPVQFKSSEKLTRTFFRLTRDIELCGYRFYSQIQVFDKKDVALNNAYLICASCSVLLLIKID
jgi:hypothetical protein